MKTITYSKAFEKFLKNDTRYRYKILVSLAGKQIQIENISDDQFFHLVCKFADDTYHEVNGR